MDSHRELHRKNMAQCFLVAWEMLSTSTFPSRIGQSSGGAEGLKTRQRGKHQVKTAGKTQTWCSNPGTQEVEAGGQQAPDQPYSYKVRLCLKK